MSAFTDSEKAPGIEATNGEEVEVLIQTFGIQSDLRGRASYHLQRLKSERDELAKEIKEYQRIANEAITGEEMETHAADQMSMEIDTLLTKVNRMYEANVTLERERDEARAEFKDISESLVILWKAGMCALIDSEIKDLYENDPDCGIFPAPEEHIAAVRNIQEWMEILEKEKKQPTQDDKQEGK